jgi:hypothetical protein
LSDSARSTALHNAKQGRGIIAVGSFTAGRPTQRQFHGFARLFFRGGIRRAFIKNHHDVGAEIPLDLHGILRPQKNRAAIDRGFERHALFRNLAQLAEAPYLEAAGIREDGFLPANKIVQVAVGFHHFCTGAQHQMKGVAQDDLGAGGFDIPWQHTFYRAIGAHGHKSRSLDITTRERHGATTGGTVLRMQFEGHKRHGAQYNGSVFPKQCL